MNRRTQLRAIELRRAKRLKRQAKMARRQHRPRVVVEEEAA